MDIRKRFMEFVSVNSENGCWEWDGVIRSGYGRFHKDGKMETAHRVSWQIHNGSINEFLVLHKCDNKCCVNPEHLYIGDAKTNRQDCVSRGRTNQGRDKDGKYITRKRARTNTRTRTSIENT